MRNFTLLSIFMVGLILSGCGKTKELVITAENAGDVVVVNSDNSELADFFDVVPNSYELVSNNDTLQFELSFVVNKAVKEYMRGEFMSFALVPLNGEKNAIEDIVFTACCGKEKSEELFNASEGTNVNVRFQYIPTNDDERDLIMKELCFCRVELNLADMVFEEVNDEPGYDDYMDMHVQARIEGNEEVIMATTETMAEAQMEGLLTPEQETRWANIDAEVEKAKSK